MTRSNLILARRNVGLLVEGAIEDVPESEWGTSLLCAFFCWMDRLIEKSEWDFGEEARELCGYSDGP